MYGKGMQIIKVAVAAVVFAYLTVILLLLGIFYIYIYISAVKISTLMQAINFFSLTR